MIEKKAHFHEFNLQSTMRMKILKLPDKGNFKSSLTWWYTPKTHEDNITILGVDDIYTKSQDEGNKHILEVDDLSTNLKDGYNNNIIKVVDLYTNHKMKITNMFIKLIIHTQNIK